MNKNRIFLLIGIVNILNAEQNRSEQHSYVKKYLHDREKRYAVAASVTGKEIHDMVNPFCLDTDEYTSKKFGYLPDTVCKRGCEEFMALRSVAGEREYKQFIDILNKTDECVTEYRKFFFSITKNINNYVKNGYLKENKEGLEYRLWVIGHEVDLAKMAAKADELNQDCAGLQGEIENVEAKIARVIQIRRDTEQKLNGPLDIESLDKMSSAEEQFDCYREIIKTNQQEEIILRARIKDLTLHRDNQKREAEKIAEKFRNSVES